MLSTLGSEALSDQTRSAFGILDMHPLPSWIVEKESLSIVFANKAAVEMYGYTFEEFTNFNLLTIFIEDSRIRFFSKASPDPDVKNYNGQYHHCRKDGKIIIVELYASSFDADGSSYFQVSAVDLTEKTLLLHSAEEEKKRYKTYIQQSSEGIYCQEFRVPFNIHDGADDFIVHSKNTSYLSECNDSMARMYGYHFADEMKGIESEQLLDYSDPMNIEILKQFIADGFKSLNAETHEKDRYGNSRYFLNNAIGIIEDGYLKRVWGTQRDITERKEAELRLRETENRFRDVADSAPVMIWMSDINDRTSYVNKCWEDFTGLNLEEFRYLGWHALVHTDDLQMAVEEYNRAFETRETFNQVYRIRHQSGEFRWIMDTCVPRFLEDGSFIGYIGTTVDIHFQKKTEEQLRYNATILENVSDIVVTTDLNFKIRGWNKPAEKYFGVTESEARGRNVGQLLRFDYSGTSQEEAAIDLEKNGIWNGEVSFRDKKGNTKYFLYTVKYVYDDNGKKIGFLSVGRNITDRKQIEKQLLKSEQFYRTLIADSLGGTALVSETGNVTFISPSVKNILGYEADEFIGKNCFDFIHPEDFKKAFESFEKVVQNPYSKFIVVRLLHKDGSWVWCMVRAHNLLGNPNINSLVLYFHDDTLRKQMEDALKESESKFRNLIADLPIGVAILDKLGKTILCNDALAEIFGVTKEDLYGKLIGSFTLDPIHEDSRKFTLQDRPGYKVIHEKAALKDVVMGCYTPGREGRIWLLINGMPILDANGEIIHLISSVKDITERKKMEMEMLTKQINHQKQLTQASIDAQENERHEIGKELHDSIGQQLTTIKLLLDLAKTTAADEPTNKMVSNALNSVNDVINEIRAMSRSLIPSTLKDLGLVESIYELIDSISRTQAVKIQFRRIGFREDKLRENQKLTLFRIIQEQINNIVKHSASQTALIELSIQDKQIILKIQDNGKGFDPKKQRKGVGFINMKNRAELFGGNMEVIAEPGKGCRLHINFPVNIGK